MTTQELEKNKELLRDLKCEGARIFSDEIIDWLAEHGFFAAPASTKYHGNYAGGLFEHSWNVGKELQNLTDKLGLKWDRPISPWVIGIFHDLCKIDQYKWDGNTKTFEYSNKPVIKGHGTKSLIYALQICSITPEEQACIIYHMGAFTDSKEWSCYTDAIHKFPNVLYTHTADMIASHILEV